jgi:P-type Cu+ transporter
MTWPKRRRSSTSCDDRLLVPERCRIARRTIQTIKVNLGFPAIDNSAGIGLGAVGVLPPLFVAAAQALPDLDIMANSARRLRPPNWSRV